MFSTINRMVLWLVCGCLIGGGWSCNTMDDDLIYKANGKIADPAELSAGSSTVFMNSIRAYDMPSEWVTGDLLNRFLLGDQLYDDPRTATQDSKSPGGGLGPLYVGFACGSCHKNAGRTYSTLFANGGSGNSGFSSMLVYITKKTGGYFRQYGRVLHDQTIVGVKAEGKLHVEYDETHYTFPDGEQYSLIKPRYSITGWYADSIPPEDLIIDVHIPLRHVGMGQMMALHVDELRRLAKQSNYPEYGISGKLNVITERNKSYIGVSGTKAHHADLTVELGFSSDLGVTNDRFPEEVGHGQSNVAGFSHYGIQISTRDMEDVDLYMSCLGVPARRNVNNPVVKRGEANFYKAKCHLCHTPTLHTRADAPVLLNGTRLPWLCNQTIHPYSDYLLHDMGKELSNHVKIGLASAEEWRTTPLWGIGLQETVNGHTQLLHDGRARNFVEAIMWHGGEGAVSRSIFKNMKKDDRDALITFLRSL